jgi:hypothetical protein
MAYLLNVVSDFAQFVSAGPESGTQYHSEQPGSTTVIKLYLQPDGRDERVTRQIDFHSNAAIIPERYESGSASRHRSTEDTPRKERFQDVQPPN